MQIASQHSKAVGKRPWVGVKERLLLNGIALHSADVSPRDIQLAALVEADFTDPSLALRNWTAMPAGKTTNTIAFNRLVEFAFAHPPMQNFGERGQRKLLL